MGNRQGKNKDLQQDGDIIERSGSKRGSGRKKKKDTDKVGDSSSGNDVVDGKRRSLPARAPAENTPAAPVIMRTRDDGDVDKRPKMGRLSGSFNVPETRSSSAAQRKANNVADFEDLVAARPAGASGLPPKTAELKVYRSYSSLAEEVKKVQMYDGQPSLANVKVYRKTPDSRPLSAGQRTMSLPRGFDRSRNLPSLTGGDFQGNGRAPWGGGGGGGNGTSGGGRNDVIEKRMSAPAMRSTTLPRLYGNAVTSSTAGYRVSKDDLPATLSIQRRLKQFETHLVRNLVTKISRLDPESQLAIVPVAIRLGRPNQVITLRDYIEDPRAVPDDLVDRAARGECALCVPPAMFTGMAHFRHERSGDRSDWPTLARDLVTCVAAEAATEISRMYEYQIALLAGDSSVALLAEHAAERIVGFVLNDLQTPRLDRNTVVQGVVRGKRPYSPMNPLNPVYVSVIVGLKELKWNLYDVFDKPGLRKDVMLVHEWVPAPGDDDRCPWKFHTSRSADPMLYGYRGQLVEWDFIQNHFRINGLDETAYGEEMSWRFDDFHRLYPPFKRLFGARAMKRYYTEQARAVGTRARPLPIDRFLMQAVQGAAYARDAIQPVYRPLEPFTLAEVDGVDWTGVDLPRSLLPKKGGGVQTPLSPSGEFPVFTPYSQGGATISMAVPQQQQYCSPNWPTTGYSPGGAIQRQSYTPQFGSAEERVFPRASPYFGESANVPQRYTPVQDRPYAAPQSYSPAGSVVRNYSPDGRNPSVSQYYSPGGTLRKIYSSPPETETKTEFLAVRASLPPYYSPGGTLRRGLPANGKPSASSNSAGDATPRSHSPGGVVVPVVQNHSTEVAAIDNSVVDPRFANYTLVEEVTTVHSIKASNV